MNLPLPGADYLTESADQFRTDVLHGLQQADKTLPCKYLYDARGSHLFDQICELDEYYLTRAETEIMGRHAEEIGQRIGIGATLIEYGSGSSIKTRYVLDNSQTPRAYVPVDISPTHLKDAAAAIARRYPELDVVPVCADFTRPFELPLEGQHDNRTVYFPGSTIGNLRPEEASNLLKSIAEQVQGGSGGLVIGIDLQKEPRVLEDAYNDSQGVTAQFNLNLLVRMKRELGAELELDGFEHVARYNDVDHRIEIYIRSKYDQEVAIDDQVIQLRADELIHTEYSHKYTIDGFASAALETGLKFEQHWMDEKGQFGVLYFSAG